MHMRDVDRNYPCISTLLRQGDRARLSSEQDLGLGLALPLLLLLNLLPSTLKLLLLHDRQYIS